MKLLRPKLRSVKMSCFIAISISANATQAQVPSREYEVSAESLSCVKEHIEQYAKLFSGENTNGILIRLDLCPEIPSNVFDGLIENSTAGPAGLQPTIVTSVDRLVFLAPDDIDCIRKLDTSDLEKVVELELPNCSLSPASDE